MTSIAGGIARRLPENLSTDPAPFNQQAYTESNNPRALVVLDGQWVFSPLEYTLTLAIHGAADTATVILPNQGNPDWTQVLRRGVEVSNSDQPVYIQIFAGFWDGPGNPTISDLKLRFFGIVDQYEIDLGPPNDWTMFSCRSMAAPLIDAKIVVPLDKNFTTQQFITKMTQQYGMPAPKFNLIAAPNTMQQVLAQQLIAGVHSYPVWEMFVRAALADDCDVWVDQTGVVNYQARTRINRPQTNMRWGRDIGAGSKLRHSPQFSKNVQVDIKIYNPTTKTATITRAILSSDGSSMELMSGTRTVTSEKVFGTLNTVSHSVSQPYASMGGNLPSFATTTQSTQAPDSGAFNASGSQGQVAGDSGKERYVKWIKGPIKQQDALNQARQMFLEISQHEYQAELMVPVSKRLQDFDINHNVNLVGIPYQFFNGQYWPREILEHWRKPSEHSGEERDGIGWTWDIHAVNHEPPQGLGVR